MNTPFLILGAGGHARVLIDTLRKAGKPIMGILDATDATRGQLLDGVEILGSDALLDTFSPHEVQLTIGLGAVNAKGLALRERLYQQAGQKGFSFGQVIHPSALIADWVSLASGVQIMAGVIIQPGVVLHENVLINTRATLDHDCAIGPHTHIAPGVVFSGAVRVGSRTMIGTAAVARQSVVVGDDVTIGAGAVITADIPSGATAVGIPARPIR